MSFPGGNRKVTLSVSLAAWEERGTAVSRALTLDAHPCLSRAQRRDAVSAAETQREGFGGTFPGRDPPKTPPLVPRNPSRPVLSHCRGVLGYLAHVSISCPISRMFNLFPKVRIIHSSWSTAMGVPEMVFCTRMSGVDLDKQGRERDWHKHTRRNPGGGFHSSDFHLAGSQKCPHLSSATPARGEV